MGDLSFASLVNLIDTLESDPIKFRKAYILLKFFPVDIRTILMARVDYKTKSLAELAELADRLKLQQMSRSGGVSRCTPHVAAIAGTCGVGDGELEDTPLDDSWEIECRQHIEICSVEARGYGRYNDFSLCRNHALFGRDT